MYKITKIETQGNPEWIDDAIKAFNEFANDPSLFQRLKDRYGWYVDAEAGTALVSIGGASVTLGIERLSVQWGIHPDSATVQRRAEMIAVMTCDDCRKVDCEFRSRVSSVEPWSPLSAMYSVGNVAPLPTVGGPCGRLEPIAGSAIEVEFYPVIAASRSDADPSNDAPMLSAGLAALSVCLADGNGLEAVTALQAIAAKDFELDGECHGCGHADSEHSDSGGCTVPGCDCPASCDQISPPPVVLWEGNADPITPPADGWVLETNSSTPNWRGVWYPTKEQAITAEDEFYGDSSGNSARDFSRVYWCPLDSSAPEPTPQAVCYCRGCGAEMEPDRCKTCMYQYMHSDQDEIDAWLLATNA